MEQAEAQLDGFLARFTPEVEDLARQLLGRMRELVPGANILVYDNYNSLAIGFCADDKPSHAVVSLAVFPRWVTLCFLFGKGLPDPDNLLSRGGSRVRHVRLHHAQAIEDPGILALIEEAIARSEPTFDSASGQRLVIRSVSEKQRPRRPGK
jgi:hypothetical protein